jgi:UDP:flavonoid glycosyltransferase YjiC (YdhE family)
MGLVPHRGGDWRRSPWPGAIGTPLPHPPGRDQADNAAAAAELGAAIALEPGTTSGEIRAAVSRALTSPVLRRAARRLAGEMAACGGGPAAAEEVEQVALRRAASVA